MNKLNEDTSKYLRNLTPKQSSLKGAELLRKWQSKMAEPRGMTDYDELIERLKEILADDWISDRLAIRYTEALKTAITAITTLQTKLKTAEEWDVIESQRNEKLARDNARLRGRLERLGDAEQISDCKTDSLCSAVEAKARIEYAKASLQDAATGEGE